MTNAIRVGLCANSERQGAAREGCAAVINRRDQRVTHAPLCLLAHSPRLTLRPAPLRCHALAAPRAATGFSRRKPPTRYLTRREQPRFRSSARRHRPLLFIARRVLERRATPAERETRLHLEAGDTTPARRQTSADRCTGPDIGAPVAARPRPAALPRSLTRPRKPPRESGAPPAPAAAGTAPPAATPSAPRVASPRRDIQHRWPVNDCRLLA
ncbi:jg5286 [Pararge aegeria aegeria]|uniref:Jg5286 protein n=1 Tax=Pararge aegeria aegeria TaxID=348720 RepID=A0A8S4R9G6_9NEOP|nr:jg5286 [Pararge aegeria aegeria]